jgi:hypothetical protein
MPQTEDESITKSQQFGLIYSQSGHFYSVLPDAPHPLPFGQYNLGESHVIDGLIGSMSHFNTYYQLVPSFGVNQYPHPYKANPYYPSPIPQTTFMVPPTPMMGGHIPTPPTNSVQKPLPVPLATPSYKSNSGGNTSTSCNQYMPSPQGKPYYYFLGPPQFVSPPP